MFNCSDSPNRLLQFSYILLIALFVIVLISKKNVRGVESNVIYTIERINSDNNALYNNPKEIPYSITQYSPLYYMISDAFLSTFNFPIEGNSYWVRFTLRLLNLLFFLVIIVIGIKLVEFIQEDSLDSFTKKVFVLLVTVFTSPWYFVSRPDVLVSLFFIATAYFSLVGIGRKKSMYLFLAGFLSLLAFLSKQNGLLIVLFTGSFLLLKLRFKLLLHYALGVISSGLVFAMIYIAAGYSLEWISVNLIKGVDNGIDIQNAINSAIIPFILVFGFPLLIIVTLVVKKRSFIKENINQQYLLLFSLLAIGSALLTCIKVGSAENYFNDFILFSIVLTFSLERKITRKALFLCVLFSISLCTYQIFRYAPRALYFTLFNKHYTELTYSKSIIDKYDKGNFFFTNIRNLILDYPDRCIFPQYEIFNTGIKNPYSNVIYKEIIDEIDYDKVDLLIIDNNIECIPINFELYKLIDEFRNIKVYERR